MAPNKQTELFYKMCFVFPVYQVMEIKHSGKEVCLYEAFIQSGQVNAP